jgi:hypothetical protein
MVGADARGDAEMMEGSGFQIHRFPDARLWNRPSSKAAGLTVYVQTPDDLLTLAI